MIRINLLGATKAKKGKRPAVSFPLEVESSGQGLELLLAGLVVLLITLAGNGAWYWKLTHETTKIQEDTARAQADFARLTQVKISYQELERQKNAYKRRVDVITDLQSRQAGPARLLSLVGETINRTDEVWLSTMNDDGNNVNVKGTALSIHSVANLMHNLKNTGYFKNVEIKSSYQDEKVQDMQAFVFELSCEKQQATPVAAQPKPGQPKS
jgi:type IV pilus assembly protein PilN